MDVKLRPDSLDGPVTALAFDFGTQRIGVAAGQSLTGTAQAVAVLKANEGKPRWEQVEELITQWKPDLFVVGLPYNMDGSDSELLALAVKFGNRLSGRFNLPWYGMDERLSSREAMEELDPPSPCKKRKAIDDVAARIILQNWFAELQAC